MIDQNKKQWSKKSNYKNNLAQINNESWKRRKASPRPNFEEYLDWEVRKVQSASETKDSGCHADAQNHVMSVKIETSES